MQISNSLSITLLLKLFRCCRMLHGNRSNFWLLFDLRSVILIVIRISSLHIRLSVFLWINWSNWLKLRSKTLIDRLTVINHILSLLLETSMLILVLLHPIHSLITDLFEFSFILHINLLLNINPLFSCSHLLLPVSKAWFTCWNGWLVFVWPLLHIGISLWWRLLDAGLLTFDWCLIDDWLRIIGGHSFDCRGLSKSLVYFGIVCWIIHLSLSWLGGCQNIQTLNTCLGSRVRSRLELMELLLRLLRYILLTRHKLLIARLLAILRLLLLVHHLRRECLLSCLFYWIVLSESRLLSNLRSNWRSLIAAHKFRMRLGGRTMYNRLLLNWRHWSRLIRIAWRCWFDNWIRLLVIHWRLLVLLLLDWVHRHLQTCCPHIRLACHVRCNGLTLSSGGLWLDARGIRRRNLWLVSHLGRLLTHGRLTTWIRLLPITELLVAGLLLLPVTHVIWSLRNLSTLRCAIWSRLLLLSLVLKLLLRVALLQWLVVVRLHIFKIDFN